MIIGLFLSVLAGWFVGGLANWGADHLPRWQVGSLTSLVRDWPHYWTLWWYWQRSTCPHCGKSRSARPPLLEIGMAKAFGVSWLLLHEQPMDLPVVAGYAAFLLIVLVIDLEHRRVLNVMVMPMAVLVLLLSLLPGTPSPVNALLGGAVGFGLFLVMYILGRGRLGAGDVKLAGVIGLMTGYPTIWPALLIGTALGALAALWLMFVQGASRKTTMAYAPYLSLGALVAYLSLLRL